MVTEVTVERTVVVVWIVRVADLVAVNETVLHGDATAPLSQVVGRPGAVGAAAIRVVPALAVQSLTTSRKAMARARYTKTRAGRTAACAAPVVAVVVLAGTVDVLRVVLVVCVWCVEC